MNIIEGITGRNIVSEIKAPPVVITRVAPDRRTSRLDRYAQPQNHSSRDRGNQLKINPTASTRRGNGR